MIVAEESANSLPFDLSLTRAAWKQASGPAILDGVAWMAQIPLERQKIIALCQAHHVRWLALFGSVLRSDFRPDSDVDVLVEFEPGFVPGLLGIARLERELGGLMSERKVDLRTPEDLSPYFRQDVLDSAEVQYAAG